MQKIPHLLSIAGTDPTGGAGVQADLKSFAAHRGYGMCVVTALVAQNTEGVREIHVPPVSFLRAQLDSVSDDVSIDGVKVGMLGSAEVIKTVAQWWDETLKENLDRPPLVIDPVMVATSGDRLLESAAESALKEFLGRADVITPNVPELALLAEESPARDVTQLIVQARKVADLYDALVLAKGGHLYQETVVDALVYPQDAEGARAAEQYFESRRVPTSNTHGTGCSVSAALTALRARQFSWEESVAAVKEWMTAALETADSLDVGHGHGPINHFVNLW